MTLISFVVPVRNDRGRLEQLLDSIRASQAASGLQVQIVVVDNGSSDGSGEMAQAFGADVLRIDQGRVGHLRNLGAHRAQGELLALVDADHTIEPGWLAAALRTMDSPAVGAAGALCLAPPTATWVQRAYDRLRRRPAGRISVKWLGSGNLLVRRSVFFEVGGFDTSLTTCEDVDLCQRIRARGYDIVSDERLRNVHWGDPATLSALFKGELWRGQDNLTVSLREGLAGLLSPSIAMPIAGVAGLAAVAIGILSGWLSLAAFGGIVLALLIAARVSAMLWTSDDRSPVTVMQTTAVAGVYELARTLSLLWRFNHQTRRSEPVTPS